MGHNKQDDDKLPQRDAGATLDPPDRAALIINRESVRAAYDDDDQ